MVDLGEWTKAATKRFEQYQNDSGEPINKRRITVSGAGRFDMKDSAGYEFSDIADRLPPL